MEKYCISLEQAKELKLLGFYTKENTFFNWARERDWWEHDRKWRLSWNIDNRHYELLPAYHVGELGEIENIQENLHRICPKSCGGWRFIDTHHTEAQARGALLINLIKEGLIEVSFRKSVNN